MLDLPSIKHWTMLCTIKCWLENLQPGFVLFLHQYRLSSLQNCAASMSPCAKTKTLSSVSRPSGAFTSRWTTMLTVTWTSRRQMGSVLPLQVVCSAKILMQLLQNKAEVFTKLFMAFGPCSVFIRRRTRYSVLYLCSAFLPSSSSFLPVWVRGWHFCRKWL